MSGITTHVLDAVLGKPATGVSVRLDKRLDQPEPDRRADPSEAAVQIGLAGLDDGEPDRWTTVGEGATDADGRCRVLAKNAAPGRYRLTFKTGAYLAQTGRVSIYPEISITFDCDGGTHYHLPLLLSDNSYITYRGS